jgi:hypothetical protein
MAEEGPRVSETGSRDHTLWAGPVLGLVVLAALAGAYAWLGRPRPAPPGPPPLLHVPLAEVRAVAMVTGGKTLVLYRDLTKKGLGVRWTMGSPRGPAADATLAGGFLSDLLDLTPDRVVAHHPTAAELHQWGLQPPVSRVILSLAGGRSVEVDFGDLSPVGDYYTRVVGRSTVYLTTSTAGSQVSADPANWAPVPTNPGPGSS